MKGTDSNTDEGHQGHKLNCLAKHQGLDQEPVINMIEGISSWIKKYPLCSEIFDDLN